MSYKVAEYIYRDAAGQPLRMKIRYEPKDFRWQSYDPAVGKWDWGAEGHQADSLYRLECIAADRPTIVFGTEGEKDADSVQALGFHAASSGAAGSWQLHHSQQLKEHGCRLCIVLPDNDDAGRDHAHDVARNNLGLGIATRILK